MPGKPRCRQEQARAVLRLQREKPLIPVAVIAEEIGTHAKNVERWIMWGKMKVYLDGLRDPVKGWMTSRAAVSRFRAKLAAKLGPQLPRPAA